MGELGWRLAATEIGTRGQVASLFGDVDWLVRDEITSDEDDADPSPGLLAAAQRARETAGVEVGLAVLARERGVDTRVFIAVVTPSRAVSETRMAFLGGSLGRSRAALTAASVLLAALRAED